MENIAYLFAQLMPGVMVVKVKFDMSMGKVYYYKALESSGIKEGDKVLVEVNREVKLVDVVGLGSVDLLEPSKFEGYKFIYATVNRVDYEGVLEREGEFTKKLEELRSKARREAAVNALAEQMGGLDKLNEMITSLQGKDVV